MSIIKGTNKIVAGFGGTKRSIGEVYFSQSALATDNSGALPLFTGETIASANTIYPEFYNWVSAHTELQCTSEEYEASLTTYGECAKYVIGGGSLRLPLIRNYIKAANPSEGIKNIEAGLPDHTHKTPYGKNDNGNYHAQGGARPHISTDEWFSTIYGYSKDSTSASASNPIYGKSNTVTPASTTLYPWVVAYTAAIPASTAQAAEFQQGLSGKADTNLGNVASNIDYVVERYNDGTNWYRIYKSGWVEQGGILKNRTEEVKTFNLLKPFADTNYYGNAGICTASSMGNSYSACIYGVNSIAPVSTTQACVRTVNWSDSFWFAYGQGAK